MPGKAVAALAVAAAIMAFRGEMGGKEKVAWMLLLFGFLFIENHSIDTERRANESYRNEVRIQEENNFRDIGHDITSGVTKVVEDNQGKFNSTMSAWKDTVNTETGGDSFCYFDVHPVLDPNTVWIDAVKVGKYPLRDITVSIVDRMRNAQAMQMAIAAISKDRKPTSDEIMNAMRQVQVQDIRQSIPDFAKSRVAIGGYQLVGGGDQQSFDIVFHAFNGDWIERLELRRVNGNWVRALLVETEQKASPYFWLIDKDYPRVNGHWDVLWPRPVKGKPVWER